MLLNVREYLSKLIFMSCPFEYCRYWSSTSSCPLPPVAGTVGFSVNFCSFLKDEQCVSNASMDNAEALSVAHMQ